MTHYYSERQEGPLKPKIIEFYVRGRRISLHSGAGIFSKDRLDKGTELLIENAIIKESWSVLDMGSGAGAVGISVKILHPKAKVMMADINERAVFLCRENIRLHNLEDIEARKSDIYQNIGEKFDAILINPPQTAGKDVCFMMIDGALTHLNEGGLLQIVARHNKGGATLENRMKETFGNSRAIARGAGYRVYVSEKT